MMKQNTLTRKLNFSFDRSELVDSFCVTLLKNQFVALFGQSGVGKAEIIRMAIQQKFLTQTLNGVNGTNWRIINCDLSGNPIDNLCAAITQPDALWKSQEVLPDISDTVKNQLLQQRDALVQLYQQAQAAADEPFNILLVINDFENLLRYESLLDQQDINMHFISLLTHAIHDRSLPIYVTLGLSEQFMLDVMRYRGLAELVNTSKMIIPPLSRREINRQLPHLFAQNDISYTDDFLTHLQADIIDDPEKNSLRLRIPFLLQRMTEVCNQQPFNLSVYQQLGGLNECFDLEFNHRFAQLAEEQKEIAILLFKLIIQQNVNGTFVRYPVDFNAALKIIQDQQGKPFPARDLLAIIQTFNQGAVPLFKPFSSATNNIIDLSSSALISTWEQLEVWNSEEELDVSIYRRLVAEAFLYKDGTGKGELYKDQKLEAALHWQQNPRLNQEWAERNAPTPLPDEAWAKKYSHPFEVATAYLKESEAAHLKNITRIRKAKERKLRALRRQTRIVTGIAILALIAMGVAYFQYCKSEAKSQRIHLLGAIDNFVEAGLIDGGSNNQGLDTIRKIINTNSITKASIATLDELINDIYKKRLSVSKKSHPSVEERDALRSIEQCMTAYTNNDSVLLQASIDSILYYFGEKDYSTNLDDFGYTEYSGDMKELEKTFKNSPEEARKGVQSNPFIIRSLIEHQRVYYSFNDSTAQYRENNYSVGIYNIASNPYRDEEFAISNHLGKISVCKDNFANCYDLEGEQGSPTLAYDSQGKYLFAGNAAGELYQWNLQKDTRSLSHLKPQVRDRLKLETQQKVKATRRLLAQFPHPILGILTPNKDINDFLVLYSINKIYLIDPLTGKRIHTIQTQAPVTSVALQPEGEYLLYTAAQRTYFHPIKNLKIATQPAITFNHTTTIIIDLSNPRDSTDLVTAAVINNKIDGMNKVVLGTDRGDIIYFDMSIAEMNKLGKKSVIELNQLTDGNRRKKYHTGMITNLVFNPYKFSSQLASSSIDGTVRLRDFDKSESPQEIILSKNNHDIWTLDYKNESEIIVGENRQLRIWSINPEEIVTYLKSTRKSH